MHGGAAHWFAVTGDTPAVTSQSVTLDLQRKGTGNSDERLLFFSFFFFLPHSTRFNESKSKSCETDLRICPVLVAFWDNHGLLGSPPPVQRLAPLSMALGLASCICYPLTPCINPQRRRCSLSQDANDLTLSAAQSKRGGSQLPAAAIDRSLMAAVTFSSASSLFFYPDATEGPLQILH